MQKLKYETHNLVSFSNPTKCSLTIRPIRLLSKSNSPVSGGNPHGTLLSDWFEQRTTNGWSGCRGTVQMQSRGHHSPCSVQKPVGKSSLKEILVNCFPSLWHCSSCSYSPANALPRSLAGSAHFAIPPFVPFLLRNGKI